MICISVAANEMNHLYSQMREALCNADMVELRLDHLPVLDIPMIIARCKNYPLPLILTLRSQAQGGFFKGSEEFRLRLIEQLAEIKSAYIDLEHTISPEFLLSFREKFPTIKIILSYHDFERTPEDLEALLSDLQKKPADYYKIATKANTTLDSLRMLLFLKGKPNVVGLCMGELGTITRILGPKLNSTWTYAALNQENATAPGQLTAHTLLTTYNYRKFDQNSSIYGLIGDPVDKSLGHITHNDLIESISLNALYLKMPVKEMELPSFFSLAKAVGFSGLSVTMPHKEAVIPFLDEIEAPAQTLGAVNTIHFNQGRLIGYNTDTVGALDALEEVVDIRRKKIVILGAGGAARAIAYAALRRGAQVLILNRDPQRAIKLAEALGCSGDALEHLSTNLYDILINCTNQELPIDPELIIPESVVMDINYPSKETPLIKEALKRECRVVYGYKMFVNQALAQFQIWLKSPPALSSMKTILEEKTLASLL
jgi:3-dehydroquinate dehydratase / shikimate dehydrogenase